MVLPRRVIGRRARGVGVSVGVGGGGDERRRRRRRRASAAVALTISSGTSSSSWRRNSHFRAKVRWSMLGLSAASLRPKLARRATGEVPNDGELFQRGGRWLMFGEDMSLRQVAASPALGVVSPALEEAADVDATSVQKRASTSARLQKSMAWRAWETTQRRGPVQLDDLNPRSFLNGRQNGSASRAKKSSET